MSVQSKLAKSQIAMRNRLHDYNISQIGTETKVVRLKTTRTLEGDFDEEEVVSHDTLILYLALPEEIPITRFRKNLLQPEAKTDNVFFYDILPIDVYAQYKDNLAKDDILIRRLNVYNDSFYQVLQITETLANFQGDQLTWMKFQSAPYTAPFTQEIADIVDSYILDN